MQLYELSIRSDINDTQVYISLTENIMSQLTEFIFSIWQKRPSSVLWVAFPKKHHPNWANYSIVVFEHHQLVMQRYALYGTLVVAPAAVHPKFDSKTDFEKVWPP